MRRNKSSGFGTDLLEKGMRKVINAQEGVLATQRGRGWHNEPNRHSLASKGVKTTQTEKDKHLQFEKEYRKYQTKFNSVTLPNKKTVQYTIFELYPYEGVGKKIFAVVEKLDEDDELIDDYVSDVYDKNAGDDVWSKIEHQVEREMDKMIKDEGYKPTKFKADKWRKI